MTRGKFITFEGGEGTGKSTQVARLVERLTALGLNVVRTREPGGSPGGEDIRNLVVSGQADRWSPRTELLLMYAARSDHLERTIVPALEAGRWVVCDRFADSSRAYQGMGGGVPIQMIQQLDAAIVGPDQPDLTLILDLSVEVGLARALERAGKQSSGPGETRFESKKTAFHERLRHGFQAIARTYPDRCRLIDADASADEVSARVWAAIVPMLDLTAQ